MNAQDPIVIVGAARTPMGGFQGELRGATASDLGGVAIRGALERAGLPASEVGE
ncbi:MAG: acetyl-CoA C-acetyltransferase, partial [Pseudomonadota bacterium]